MNRTDRPSSTMMTMTATEIVFVRNNAVPGDDEMAQFGEAQSGTIIRAFITVREVISSIDTVYGNRRKADGTFMIGNSQSPWIRKAT